jgi:anti-sigma factor RsiW
MNHPPFDRWVFEDDLAETDRASLADHLSTCDACRRVAVSWQAVETELRLAGTAQPEEGFALRWKERRAAEQTDISRWQGVSALGLVFGSSGALVALKVLGNPPSLVDLTVWLSSVLGAMGVAKTMQAVLWSVVELPGIPWITALPLAGMAGAALAAAIALTVFWSFVVYRLAWRAAPVRSSIQ